MTGIVSIFDDNQITGWVISDEPAKVNLEVNGVPIVTTWAARPLKEQLTVRVFTMKLKDVWDYLETGDRLTLTHEGCDLPIASHGLHYHVSKSGSQNFATLQDKLRSNHIFNQFGKLQLSARYNRKWQKNLFNLYNRIYSFLKENRGIEIFVFYGSLLGAARSNDFISHDHDFDCSYIVPETDPAKVATFATETASALINEGYNVQCKNTTIWVSHPDYPGIYIDLFHTYFNSEGRFQSGFGWAGEIELLRSEFTGIERIDFANTQVTAPMPIERFAEFLYGDDWQTPNPGFDWKRDRKYHCLESRYSAAHKSKVYWENFYARKKDSGPSTFADFVSGSEYMRPRVVDFGCGDGRDSLQFARLGSNVLGIDQSEQGTTWATTRASKEKISAKFISADVTDVEAIRNGIESLGGKGDMLFYSRFFLHSLPPNVLNRFVEVSTELMTSDQLFALEFRTDRDEKLSKVHGGHYRNFTSGKAIENMFGKFGCSTVVFQEGNGFSPYKGEDPYLCRLIVRRQ